MFSWNSGGSHNGERSSQPYTQRQMSVDNARGRLDRWSDGKGTESRTKGLERQLSAVRKEDVRSAQQSWLSQEECTRLQTSNRRLESDNASLKAQLAEKSRVIAEMQDALQRRTNAEQALAIAHTSVEEYRRKLSTLEEAFKDKETMLGLRSAELREAQAYLPMTDTISYADVLTMVQRLNAEIFQLAALVADAFAFDGRGLPRDQLQKQWETSAGWVGRGMTELLMSMRNGGDPACVQVALQAFLTRFAMRIINSWDAAVDTQRDIILNGIFWRMLQDESMAVCGKWKVLTKRHLKSLDTPSVVSQLKDHILQYVSDLLLVSGAKAAPPGILEIISERFGDKVTDIVTSAVSIQRATKEDIVSSEIRLILPRYNEPFVDERMEDIEKPERDAAADSLGATSTEHVLCATEIGVVRLEKGMTSEGGEHKEGTTTVTVLKSKVALRSLVEVFVRVRRP